MFNFIKNRPKSIKNIIGTLFTLLVVVIISLAFIFNNGKTNQMQQENNNESITNQNESKPQADQTPESEIQFTEIENENIEKLESEEVDQTESETESKTSDETQKPVVKQNTTKPVNKTYFNPSTPVEEQEIKAQFDPNAKPFTVTQQLESEIASDEKEKVEKSEPEIDTNEEARNLISCDVLYEKYGLANLNRDHPDYTDRRDSDNDGIACEK